MPTLVLKDNPMDEKTYEPYGPEWKKELMQFKKTELIELLRDALMKNKTTISGGGGWIYRINLKSLK